MSVIIVRDNNRVPTTNVRVVYDVIAGPQDFPGQQRGRLLGPTGSWNNGVSPSLYDYSVINSKPKILLAYPYGISTDKPKPAPSDLHRQIPFKLELHTSDIKFFFMNNSSRIVYSIDNELNLFNISLIRKFLQTLQRRRIKRVRCESGEPGAT